MIKKLSIIIYLSAVILICADTPDQDSEEQKTNKMDDICKTFIFIRPDITERFESPRLLSAHEIKYYKECRERNRKNNEEKNG